MAIEGTPDEARALFVQAWEARTDDYDACIAAHFVARHQTTPEETLRWNVLALRHAEAVTDGRVTEFMASLYLNLGDAYARVDDRVAARQAAGKARDHLASLPSGGYREFVALGIDRLEGRLHSPSR
ncbi:MAG: hypothetical protein M3Z05_18610 [Gemmatimonadota bacterium]|nr:hypothetical protein [Gemmatimonadota bacterium]